MSTRAPVRSVLRSPARLAARAAAFALCAGLASAQIKLGMVQGDGSGDHLGTDVAAVGDVDGDGKTDYVVGAPYPFSGSHVRYARVHSGASGATLFTFSSTVTDDMFGQRVAGAGDIDDDGYPDVIVGSTYLDAADTTGRAQVYSGNDGTLLLTISGAVVADFFDAAPVAGVGDLDGDQHDDVLVAEPFDDTAAFNAGRIRVHSGANGSVIRECLGAAASERLGLSVAAAGDVDGDGMPDVIAGGGTNPNLGTARVFSGLDGSLLHTFNGATALDGFGYAVGGVGDANGDGFDDVIVGAPFDSTAGSQSGLAKVYSGADGSVLHTLLGAPFSQRFGIAVGGAGDRNGDGFDDFMVSTEKDTSLGSGTGSVVIYSGASGQVLHKLISGGTQDGFGCAAAALGDLDGDGGGDYLVGAKSADFVFPNYGAAWVLSLASTYTNYCTSTPNSTGVAATLHGDGYGTWSNNDLVVTASDLPTNQSALLIASETQGFAPLGNGFLCLAPKVWRIVPVLSSGATGSVTVAVNHNVVPWFYLLNPGETWNFQLWYRDTAAGGAGFNLSDGLRVTFLP